MSGFQAAYIPIGVPTFHLESAKKEFEKSVAMLKTLTDECVYPDEMLLAIDKLDDFLDKINPDLIIVQNVTFANSAYISEVLKRFDTPVLLWTLREPVIDGGRLRLNSLTGAYSAANTLMYMRNGSFEYVFGSPEENDVVKKILAVIKAAKIKKMLKSLKIASIGHTPQGFGFGRAEDIDMLKYFGITLESIEARELIDAAKAYDREEIEEYLDKAAACTRGFDTIPEVNREGFARLWKAYEEYVTSNGIGALSSRCWPDFFTSFGTPVCMVLAMLNDMGISSACEADTYGALTMYIGQQLSGKPVFFGDPVSLDEAENTITYWHCGTAAVSLADPSTGAGVDVHCNRKIGPTLDFECRGAEHVTIFRIGRRSDGKFRFFIAGGKALPKPRQFNGCSVVAETENPSKEIVMKSVSDGWEPHFAVIYDDVKDELISLGHMLDMEVCEY